MCLAQDDNGDLHKGFDGGIDRRVETNLTLASRGEANAERPRQPHAWPAWLPLRVAGIAVRQGSVSEKVRPGASKL